MAPLSHVLALSVVLFGIGAIGVLTRSHLVVVLMCLELMLSAVLLSLVTFARHLGDGSAQGFAAFVAMVGVLEIAVGVGVVVSLVRQRGSPSARAASGLRG